MISFFVNASVFAALGQLLRHLRFAPSRAVLIQLFQENVSKPDIVAVVLESDVAGARQVLEGGLEFILGAVGILLGCGPLIEIGAYDALAVEGDLNHGTLAAYLNMVPFANGFDGVRAGDDGIVERSTIMSADNVLVVGVEELDFETALDRVLGVGAYEDSAVAIAAELELEIEDEVAVGVVRPNGSTASDAPERAVLGIGFPYRLEFRGQVRPAIEALAVEESGEPFRGLGLGGVNGRAELGNEEREGEEGNEVSEVS